GAGEEVVQVVAGAEPRPLPAQEHHAHGRVGLGGAQGAFERRVHGKRKGVALLGTVEAHFAHARRARDANRFIHGGTLPSAPLARNSRSSAALKPRRSLSTCSVCSPSSGGARGYSSALREKRTGLRTWGTRPAVGCGRSMRTPRWRTCTSANAWAMSLIGPHGTCACWRRASHAAVVWVASAAWMRAVSSPRCATRAALSVKRASLLSVSRPAARQKLTNCRSLPTASIRCPSAVANAW